MEHHAGMMKLYWGESWGYEKEIRIKLKSITT